MLGTRPRVDWRARWLALMFDGNPCRECGGDHTAHEAINVNGQPFARCTRLTARSQGEVFERQFAVRREGRRS